MKGVNIILIALRLTSFLPNMALAFFKRICNSREYMCTKKIAVNDQLGTIMQTLVNQVLFSLSACILIRNLANCCDSKVSS